MSKKGRIFSITESYSHNPVTIEVGQMFQINGEETKVKSIVDEEFDVGGGKLRIFYCGYDVEGNILFKYISDSVNVHYY